MLPSLQRKLAGIVVDKRWHATAVNVPDVPKCEIRPKNAGIWAQPDAVMIDVDQKHKPN
jgi:hypothetical protein